MSLKPFVYDDCCLLTNIDLNSQRIRQLLQRRFTSNSYKTSFDFKSFLPEQLSNNAKVTRSLLRCQPQLQSNGDYEDIISSDSSSSSEGEEDEKELGSTNDENDDDYLNQLADWDPAHFQPGIETDIENEEENVIQAIGIVNDDEEDSPMDHSAVESTSTTQVEDLLVTYIHRPLKTEPISYDDDNVFDHLPQLDGHVDCLPTQSSTQSKGNYNEKRLDDVIAKVTANTPAPTKIIQLHQIPSSLTKFRLNNDKKKKSTPQSPRKSCPIPSKVPRMKEQPIKESKPIKKLPPPLISTVMKNNENAIRPLYTSIPTTPTKLQQSFRTLSENGSIRQKRDERKISTTRSPEEKISLHQKERKPPSSNKHRSHSQSQRSSTESKEKTASDHMSLAEQKLTHYRKQHHSKHPIPKPSKSVSHSTSSSTKSKSKENIQTSSKPSQVLSERSGLTPTTSTSDDHNQPIKKKKKKKKLKRLDTEESKKLPQTKPNNLSEKPKKQKSIEHYVVKKTQSTSERTKALVETKRTDDQVIKAAASSSIECIIIDDDDEGDEQLNKNTVDNNDDDIQEIEQENYSIAHDIRHREKLLDHAVHSPVMHIKWLSNLEYLLREHILLCHEKLFQPLNKLQGDSLQIKQDLPVHCSSYRIDPSFISVIIINFVKMFILRNSLNDEQELSFIQIGLTSHLRYLLIELPTYKHVDEKTSTDEYCSQCHQYSLIINILFDLLFDLIEYDLCDMTCKRNYRSSLIEDDYFTRFLQSKTVKRHSSSRIKLIVYFIELIGMHMNKCSSRKSFQFNQNEDKIFRSMEDVLRNILSQKNNYVNERMSICFNIMELCLLFVHEGEMRIKQMALFLAELCQNNPTYSKLFLFDKNLFVDIRLLLVKELIWNKFQMKFISINDVNEFFRKILGILTPSDPLDESSLLLVRSLFDSYADLITEIKALPVMHSNFAQHLTSVLRNHLKSIHQQLLEVLSNSDISFEQTMRTMLFFRLLKCKWHKL